MHNEFARNKQRDARRLYQLTKHIANEGHAFRKFGTGSIVSLGEIPEVRLQPRQWLASCDTCHVQFVQEKGIDVRAHLLDFHQKHYCASRMHLSVVGTQPISELRAWVTQLFDGVRAWRPACCACCVRCIHTMCGMHVECAKNVNIDYGSVGTL